MAPHGESLCKVSKPARVSSDNHNHNHNHIQRTRSDISFELTKMEGVEKLATLTAISEVEDAKCECCGMCEECTAEYIERVREKLLGKFLCGLCSEAVKEELEKNGGKREEALSAHMSACVRFNKYGRAFPVLFQAQAMKEMLKKKKSKSFNPRDNNGQPPNKGPLSRSSSCIPAITRDLNDLTLAN